MFCKNCGKEVVNNCIICPNCKFEIGSIDTGNEAFIFLGYLIPIVGFILYFIWKDEKPKTAKMLLIGAGVSTAFYAFIFIMILLFYAIIYFIILVMLLSF